MTCRWSATNEAFFPAAEDFDAHDALMAIAEGSVVRCRRAAGA